MVQLIAAARAGWVFEYPLDDVYIHLAMAEGLAAGGYGVNPGEVASASSSPLYPFLLLPFVGTEMHRFVPLAWNVLGLAASAWLWGALLAEAGYGRGRLRLAGLVAAGLGPLALNAFGVAYAGMEHALHTAASLAILLGLIRTARTDRVPSILLGGCLAAPLLRPEGVALVLLSAWLLDCWGHRRAAIWAVALGCVPPAGFALGLVAMGLDPLPSSVLAKLGGASGGSFGDRIVDGFGNNLDPLAGRLMLLIAIGLLLVLLRRPADRLTGVGIAVILSLLVHLGVGQIGWMDRYEGYAIVTGGAALLILAATVGRRTALIATALLLAAGSDVYLDDVNDRLTPNGRAIHLQQAQMARLIDDHLQEPVAVNDLGHVAWQNDLYVLDLYGLASTEARRIRLSDPERGWADALAERHGTALAMIYDHFLPRAVGPDWVRLGGLHIEGSQGAVGGHTVAFYATDPAEAPRLVPVLDEWAEGLPAGAAYLRMSFLPPYLVMPTPR